ncbi:MAG TPA: VOC family protein [Pyrinomonadaceae bacterium]|jgi:PhnB protein|nr:VOC family protein [Pyrinomonadaceae bacterium]
MTEIKAIPTGYEGAMPYLICKNAEQAIDFYKRAFGAEEILRIGSPGMVGHAEMRIGKALFMLADEFPPNALSPETVGGTPVSIYIYVDDVDQFTERAVAEGLEVIRPVADQFYGDRSGFFRDPFGHQWGFATHKEDLTAEELNERAKTAHS